jgi:hypothetical protein
MGKNKPSGSLPVVQSAVAVIQVSEVMASASQKLKERVDSVFEMHPGDLVVFCADGKGMNGGDESEDAEQHFAIMEDGEETWEDAREMPVQYDDDGAHDQEMETQQPQYYSQYEGYTLLNIEEEDQDITTPSSAQDTITFTTSNPFTSPPHKLSTTSNIGPLGMPARNHSITSASTSLSTSPSKSSSYTSRRTSMTSFSSVPSFHRKSRSTTSSIAEHLDNVHPAPPDYKTAKLLRAASHAAEKWRIVREDASRRGATERDRELDAILENELACRPMGRREWNDVFVDEGEKGFWGNGTHGLDWDGVL